jgi:MinD superfamily P-loop ATPase
MQFDWNCLPVLQPLSLEQLLKRKQAEEEARAKVQPDPTSCACCAVCDSNAADPKITYLAMLAYAQQQGCMGCQLCGKPC